MHKKPEPQSALSPGYFNTPPKLDEVTLAWGSAMPSCSTEKSLTKIFALRNYPHSPEEIAEEIRVDEEGQLWWKRRKKGRKFYDRPLGTLNKGGYLRISLDHTMYYNHVICFCLYHKRWPKAELQIDHLNRVRTDNRKENLHEVTSSQNHLNSEILPSHNTSGYKNVFYSNTHQKWVVWWSVHRQPTVKYFKTCEEAVNWRNYINHLTSDVRL